MITFLTFGEAQIIGGIVPNLIAFGLFVGAIGYFASTGKMAEIVRLEKEELTDLKVTAGPGGRSLEFMGLVPQQLGAGLWLNKNYLSST